MDQFEEITNKNQRMMRTIISVPIILTSVFLLVFAYYFPCVSKMRNIKAVQSDIMKDDDITQEELSWYISSLEMDYSLPGSDFMLDDREYNIILLSLYVRNRNFENIPSLFERLVVRDDFSAYHFYRGLSHFEAGELDDARSEMEKFLQIRSGENYEDLDPNFALRVSKMEEDAHLVVESIGVFEDVRENLFKNNGILSQDLKTSISTMENAEKLTGIVRSDDYNFFLIESCLAGKEYDKVIERSQKMIEAKDASLYHFYLGLMYYDQKREKAAMTEIQKFLSDEPSSYSGLGIEKKIDDSRLFLFAEYYDMGKYADSLMVAKEIFDFRKGQYSSSEDFEIFREFESIMDGKKVYQTFLPDLDQDGISDKLEEMLSTDKGDKDTDGDSYEDRDEFLSGHSPLVGFPKDLLTDKEYCVMYDRFITRYPFFDSNYD